MRFKSGEIWHVTHIIMTAAAFSARTARPHQENEYRLAWSSSQRTVNSLFSRLAVIEMDFMLACSGGPMPSRTSVRGTNGGFARGEIAKHSRRGCQLALIARWPLNSPARPNQNGRGQ